jgi:flagellar hook-length control protein FliK
MREIVMSSPELTQATADAEPMAPLTSQADAPPSEIDLVPGTAPDALTRAAETAADLAQASKEAAGQPVETQSDGTAPDIMTAQTDEDEDAARPKAEIPHAAMASVMPATPAMANGKTRAEPPAGVNARAAGVTDMANARQIGTADTAQRERISKLVAPIRSERSVPSFAEAAIDTAMTGSSSSSQAAPAPFQSLIQTAAAPSAPSVNPAAGALANPAQAAMSATLVAAPEEITDIVTTRLGAGDRPEKIAIQLDPPELGRVSIEFKFDGQGLQHVVVTGETPEAMTKLRQMHAQLVQSLEQNGLSASNMSFSQDTPQRHPQWQDGVGNGLTGAIERESQTDVQHIVNYRGRTNMIATSGINLKL